MAVRRGAGKLGSETNGTIAFERTTGVTMNSDHAHSREENHDAQYGLGFHVRLFWGRSPEIGEVSLEKRCNVEFFAGKCASNKREIDGDIAVRRGARKLVNKTDGAIAFKRAAPVIVNSAHAHSREENYDAQYRHAFHGEQGLNLTQELFNATLSCQADRLSAILSYYK